jgi:hypothetical protein
VTTRAMFLATEIATEVGMAVEAVPLTTAPVFAIFEFPLAATSEDVKWYLVQWHQAVRGTALEHIQVLCIRAGGVRITMLDATGVQVSQVGSV